MKKKYFLSGGGNKIKELLIDEIETLNKAFDELSENRKLNWGYSFLEKNYHVLFEETDKVFSTLSKNHPNSWSELESATQSINFYFFNYLTSINTFLDHNLKFISNRFGADSIEKSDFTNLTHTLYDSHFEYRLLYSLRNYTSHSGFSICAINSEEILIGYNRKGVNYQPCLLRSELLKNGKFKKIIKEDLKSQREKISIFDLISKSLDHYKSLNALVNKSLSKSIDGHKQNISNILEIKRGEIETKQLIIDDGSKKKIAQIPYHYL